jgi:hypothetical protein
MFQIKVLENTQNTQFMFNNFFSKIVPFFEIMWKNSVEPGRPQMTIWCMHIVCWIPKARNNHSESVTLIAFPLQQWLHIYHSALHRTYIACRVRYFCKATYIPIYYIVLENTKCHFSQNR